MSHKAVAAKTQAPELKRLAVIVDEWNEERQAFNSACCPAVKVTAVETFEWLPDELFVLHSLDGCALSNSSTDYANQGQGHQAGAGRSNKHEQER